MEALLENPILLFFSITVLLNVFLFLLLFLRFPISTRKQIKDQSWQHTTEEVPISIIVAAKNEATNLGKNLRHLLAQKYGKFEVIVVNDQSHDNTNDIVQKLKETHQNLEIVHIDENVNNFRGKKLALTLGIKKAQYDHLVFTDADCSPVSENWLKIFNFHFQEKPSTELILGFGPLTKKFSILNLFIQFETFYTALQYFSLALIGRPYMGVGRNLGYTKQFFFKNKGFSAHLHVSSGDDDLTVNYFGNKDNTAAVLHPEAFVYSDAKQKWSEWWRQKRRHLDAGKHYKPKHKFNLSLIWFIRSLFYIGLIVGIIYMPDSMVFWMIAAFFWIVQLATYTWSLTQLKKAYLIPFSPILDALYFTVYYPIISIFTLFIKRKHAW